MIRSDFAANLTWVNTGGLVKVCEPKSNDELQKFLAKQIPYVPLGFGSNVIIPDEGSEKVMLKLTSMPNNIILQGNNLIIDAGTPNVMAIRFCISHNLSNLEFLYTIPGTIGGALYMNAGAYGSCIADNLVWAEIMNQNGKTFRVNQSEIKYEYRSSNLPNNLIFVKACFKVGNSNNVAQTVANMKQYRNDKQPRMKTFGSIFKNIPQSAWQLIKESGCENMKIGGAHISQLHCNFIINDGTATSLDIKTLIKKVQDKVLQKTGIFLEKEVIFI